VQFRSLWPMSREIPRDVPCWLSSVPVTAIHCRSRYGSVLRARMRPAGSMSEEQLPDSIQPAAGWIPSDLGMEGNFRFAPACDGSETNRHANGLTGKRGVGTARAKWRKAAAATSH
jgi:hypothetical protein